MKLIKNANGQTKLQITKDEWIKIGQHLNPATHKQDWTRAIKRFDNIHSVTKLQQYSKKLLDKISLLSLDNLTESDQALSDIIKLSQGITNSASDIKQRLIKANGLNPKG